MVITQYMTLRQSFLLILGRLERHIYGKLIAILPCSSTMFKMRQLILKKKKRELSEYKAIKIIQDHLYIIYQAIQ